MVPTPEPSSLTTWSAAARLDGLRPDMRARSIYLPALAPFPPSSWPLVSMLPVLDINGGLVEALTGRQPFRAAPPTAGIFACDPFLRPADLAGVLNRAGIGQAVNLPTIQVFGGETAAALGSVGYRVETEFQVLLRLAEYGIQPMACVTTREAAHLALRLGITRVLVYPGLVQPRDPAAWWADMAGHIAIEGGEALAWQEAPPDQASRPRRRMRL